MRGETRVAASSKGQSYDYSVEGPVVITDRALQWEYPLSFTDPTGLADSDRAEYYRKQQEKNQQSNTDSGKKILRETREGSMATLVDAKSPWLEGLSAKIEIGTWSVEEGAISTRTHVLGGSVSAIDVTIKQEFSKDWSVAGVAQGPSLMAIAGFSADGPTQGGVELGLGAGLGSAGLELSTPLGTISGGAGYGVGFHIALMPDRFVIDGWFLLSIGYESP